MRVDADKAMDIYIWWVRESEKIGGEFGVVVDKVE